MDGKYQSDAWVIRSYIESEIMDGKSIPPPSSDGCLDKIFPALIYDQCGPDKKCISLIKNISSIPTLSCKTGAAYKILYSSDGKESYPAVAFRVKTKYFANFDGEKFDALNTIEQLKESILDH